MILIGLGNNGWLNYLNSNWFRNPMPMACGTFAMTVALKPPRGGYNASWSTLMLLARSSPGALVEARKLMACLQGKLRPKIFLLDYLMFLLLGSTLRWKTLSVSFWIDECHMVSWLRSLEPLANCQSIIINSHPAHVSNQGTIHIIWCLHTARPYPRGYTCDLRSTFGCPHLSWARNWYPWAGQLTLGIIPHYNQYLTFALHIL